jgi:adenine-specific DNA-methyltransferase
VSRLGNLLRQLEKKDPDLAADLRREVEALAGRRAFGLNFERHTPETVELPGRPVRKGDKVRFLPERGQPADSVDRPLWRVVGFTSSDNGRIAELVRREDPDAKPEISSRLVADLVVVAEFRDPIYPGLVSTGRVERRAHDCLPGCPGPLAAHVPRLRVLPRQRQRHPGLDRRSPWPPSRRCPA